MVSIILINSRGKDHPDWVELAKRTAKNQLVETELIEIENFDRKKTIGQCWNEAVKKAKYDYCLFLGDDDWLSEDYCSTLYLYAMNYPNYAMWTTNMIAYDDVDKIYAPIQRICTGMWKKDYLLKYPFNEELQKGIDREYIQEMQKRGDKGFSLNHYFGYYYRKHTDYSCAGNIIFKKEPSDIYVLTTSRNFIDPIVKEWRKDKKVFVSTSEFDPFLADKAKIIFCEWLTQNAEKVSKYECDAYKILRVHSYEAFTPLIHYVKWDGFDKVIFIAEHIKRYVESKVGEIPNAVVIPVGVHVNGYDVSQKEKNNKIAYAGEISRKKGIGELLLIARGLPEYDFHIAGKFTEDDTARYFQETKPENVFLEPYSYNLPEFFKDKTYIINTSLREGNPVTILEGMSYGLKPLVRDWVGAKEIYGDYVYRNLDELKSLLRDYKPEEYKKFVEKNYNLDNTIKEINNVVSNKN